MKLAIVGSRKFSDYEILLESIGSIIAEPISEVVSGGALGADSLAESFAKEFNIPIKIFLPNWEKYGKSAGMLRNREIVQYADKLVAFWDLVSPGTANSIRLAKNANKLIKVFIV